MVLRTPLGSVLGGNIGSAGVSCSVGDRTSSVLGSPAYPPLFWASSSGNARDRTQGTESPWADAVAGMGCGAHRMVPLKRTGSCRIMDRRERSVCRGSLAISMPSMMMRPVW